VVLAKEGGNDAAENVLLLVWQEITPACRLVYDDIACQLAANKWGSALASQLVFKMRLPLR